MSDKEKFAAACRAHDSARQAYYEALRRYAALEISADEVQAVLEMFIVSNNAFDAALEEFRAGDGAEEDKRVIVAGIILSDKAIAKMKEREDEKVRAAASNEAITDKLSEPGEEIQAFEKE